jgi:hypothetical protein
MNIASPLQSYPIIAKMCGCKDRTRVIYSLSEDFHALCVDKKDILQAEIEACERLLRYLDKPERSTVEKEMVDLKTALDLLS